MKSVSKNVLLILLACILVFTLVLVACGKKKEEKKETKQPTTAETTTAAPETTTAADSEAAGEYEQIVLNLIDRYNKLLYVDGAALQADDNTTYTDGMYQYRLVTDEEFKSFGHINIYLDDTLTVDAARECFPYLVDPGSSSVPVYLYINDGSVPEGLYELQAGKGLYPYIVNEITDITVDSDTSFRATVSVEVTNADCVLEMTCVQDEGKWKIGSWNLTQ